MNLPSWGWSLKVSMQIGWEAMNLKSNKMDHFIKQEKVQFQLDKNHQDDNAFSKTSLVLSRHISSFNSSYIICMLKKWVSLIPDYSDLILLNEPWSCFGLFTSLFIHQADESFDRDLKYYKGCKSVSNTWPIPHLLGHRLKMHDAAEAGAHNRLQVQHHNLNIYAIY